MGAPPEPVYEVGSGVSEVKEVSSSSARVVSISNACGLTDSFFPQSAKLLSCCSCLACSLLHHHHDYADSYMASTCPSCSVTVTLTHAAENDQQVCSSCAYVSQ